MGRMRVLIVEDSSLVCDRLRRLLSDDFEVIGQTADVDAAGEAIARLQPDAVILDLQLARGSGFTVLRDLRCSGSKALVIVMTNHAQPYYRQACLAEGANYFIDKSAEFEAIPELLLSGI